MSDSTSTFTDHFPLIIANLLQKGQVFDVEVFNVHRSLSIDNSANLLQRVQVFDVEVFNGLI